MLTWAQTKCFDSTYNVQNLIYLELFCLVWNHIPCSRKLVREKSFTNFWSFVAIREIWRCNDIFGGAKASNPRKFFPQKSYFFANVFSFIGTGITWLHKDSVSYHTLTCKKLETRAVVINLVPRLSFSLAGGSLIPRSCSLVPRPNFLRAPCGLVEK